MVTNCTWSNIDFPGRNKYQSVKENYDTCMHMCIFFSTSTEMNECVFVLFQSDYHFEYTDCDVLGSRWRVAIPNKPDTCTGLPDPVKGTQCSK